MVQNTSLPIEEQRNFLPKWLSNGALGIYVVLLVVVSLLFFTYAMSWYFALIGIVEVSCFFYFAYLLSKKWAPISSKMYVKQLFWTSVAIRCIWVVFSYFFYLGMTGQPFEFNAGDVIFYDDMGKSGHYLLSSGKLPGYDLMNRYAAGKMAISDYGYPLYLTFIYTLFDNSIFLTRIIKCFVGAWTAVIVYRIAARNFGEKVGRTTGILCMLMPNLIFYCGLHLKETEMVFLTVAAIDQADQLLRNRKFNVWKTLPLVLCIGYLFLIRTALAVVIILALFCALVLTTSKVANWGKRILVGLLTISLLGVVIGNRVQEDVREITEVGSVQSSQQKNMQWRSEREGGNSFAKYAGAAVFAPMIFTIPFPTLVNIPGQEDQQMIHGGNYVKNITSFFTILAVLMLVFSGEWRKYVLPLSFMLGYLAVLVLSNYAQSERFHMPVLCFELMFAAYGLAQCRNKERRWFSYWLCLILVANIGWAWFKLKGRGMI